jgi:SAM-dependent methyltransferase
MQINKDTITGRNKITQAIINLIPKKLRLIINPRRKGVEEFMQYASKQMQKDSLLLDAGAGPSPYKHYFSQCKYEATDILPSNNITFMCSLEDIPRKDNYYNYIINTETLEHVDNPTAVINEFYRILKPFGQIFLTAPLNCAVHQEPYHYFNFSNYGLQKLFQDAGFFNVNIKPNGGYWHYLSNSIRDNNLTSQIKWKPLRWIVMIPERLICGILLPLILYPLDYCDRRKKYTNGWLVEATK